MEQERGRRNPSTRDAIPCLKDAIERVSIEKLMTGRIYPHFHRERYSDKTRVRTPPLLLFKLHTFPLPVLLSEQIRRTRANKKKKNNISDRYVCSICALPVPSFLSHMYESIACGTIPSLSPLIRCLRNLWAQ